MIIFTVLPCVLIAYYAFTDVNGAFTLDNFKNFWDSNYDMNKELLSLGFSPEEMGFTRGSVNVDTLLYSLWMAFLCTAICLVLGYPAAHIMADREFKLGSTLVILFVIPMWMNFLLRTIAWMTLLEDNGLINNLLVRLGLPRAQLMYNSQAVLLGMVYNYLPFMVFPIYNALNKMDYRLSEAAMDLGCNKWRTFYKVTLPLSLPGVVSGITMVFMPAVTTFFIPRLLGGGNTEMFGDLIERTFLTANNWNVGSALSLIMMVLILLSLGLLRKVDPDGEGGNML
ncbi:MAG: ABC transporter permease [Clostridiales bacterium]|nr:ABC transporter permease [Clostridiales bacterium]